MHAEGDHIKPHNYECNNKILLEHYTFIQHILFLSLLPYRIVLGLLWLFRMFKQNHITFENNYFSRYLENKFEMEYL